MARRRDRRLGSLLEKFVCVRLIHAWGVDLSLFQFDTDATWMAFFMNADGTIYGRYGTRNPGDFTLDGFVSTSQRALELHERYPGNRGQLSPKRGAEAIWKNPQSIPSLSRFREGDMSSYGCVHCHTAHEGEIVSRWKSRRPIPDSLLWKYPDPRTVGFALDPRDPVVVKDVKKDSPAWKGGLREADRLITVADQPIISKADVQWALHNAPEEGEVRLRVSRGGKTIDVAISLSARWRRADSFVRPNTTWMIQTAIAGFVAETVSASDRRKGGIDPETPAIKVRHVAGSRETSAERWKSNVLAPLRSGDLIVGVDGIKAPRTVDDLVAYLLQETGPGGAVRLQVIRRGRGRLAIGYALPDAE